MTQTCNLLAFPRFTNTRADARMATGTTTTLTRHDGGHALWEALPGEILDQIVVYMRTVVCLDIRALHRDTSFKRICALRRLCKKVAIGLWPAVSLFCPWKFCAFDQIFVKGVLIVMNGFCVQDRNINQELCSFLLTAVHNACCTKPHDNTAESLYEGLQTYLPELLRDGRVVCPAGPMRERYVRMVCVLFRYLDRYYVKRRTGRRGVQTVLETVLEHADATV